jgi:hypothetical protein
VLFIATGTFDHSRRLFIAPPGMKSGGTLMSESSPYTTFVLSLLRHQHLF